MYVLLSPSSFKGSLSSSSAAAIMRAALAPAFAAHGRSDAVVDEAPLADGGAGTLAALASPLGLSVVTCDVRASDGRVVPGRVGHSTDVRNHKGGVALLESADAVGLELVPHDRRDLLALHSRGVADLVLHALTFAPRTLYVALGDTGVVDGGAGLLEVLGWPGNAARASLALADSALAKTELVGLVDVDAPLAGPAGARRFMQQKAARALSESELEALEARLTALHPRFVNTTGAGAAGGLGAAILALGGTLRLGADFVADAIDLDSRVARADIVVTGEGRLDEQTLMGKSIARLARSCRTHHKPLVVVCGTCTLSAATLAQHGVTHVERMVHARTSLEAVLADPARHLAEATARAITPLLRAH